MLYYIPRLSKQMDFNLKLGNQKDVSESLGTIAFNHCN